MRLNCCCDSHSTTRHASSRKAQYLLQHEHEHVGRRCCCCYINVAGFRGQRLEVEGWGDGVTVSERMRIHRPLEDGSAAFSDFSTLRPVFKKVRCHDLCGRLAETMQYVCVFAKERFRVDGPSIGSGLKLKVMLVLPSIKRCMVLLSCAPCYFLLIYTCMLLTTDAASLIRHCHETVSQNKIMV